MRDIYCCANFSSTKSSYFLTCPIHCSECILHLLSCTFSIVPMVSMLEPTGREQCSGLCSIVNPCIVTLSYIHPIELYPIDLTLTKNNFINDRKCHC